MRYLIVLILLLSTPVNAVTNSQEQVDYLEEKNAEKERRRKYANELQREMVSYAWNKTKRLDFLETITQESAWNHNAEGDYRDGVPTSYGLCQWHGEPLWREKYDDPIVGDWKSQIDVCRETRQYRESLGTLNTWVYGYNKRHKRTDEFVRE